MMNRTLIVAVRLCERVKGIGIGTLSALPSIGVDGKLGEYNRGILVDALVVMLMKRLATHYQWSGRRTGPLGRDTIVVCVGMRGVWLSRFVNLLLFDTSMTIQMESFCPDPHPCILIVLCFTPTAQPP